MKRIRVPEEMIQVADAEIRACSSISSSIPDRTIAIIQKITIESVLRYISEHPQVPTDEQAKQLRDIGKEVSGQYDTQLHTAASAVAIAMEWQRRCFVQEEPEIPEEIKDLLKLSVPISLDEFMRRGLEIYRRGLRKGEQK